MPHFNVQYDLQIFAFIYKGRAPALLLHNEEWNSETKPQTHNEKPQGQ